MDALPNQAHEMTADEANALAVRIDHVVAEREDLDHIQVWQHLTRGRPAPTRNAYRAYRKYLQPANLPRMRFTGNASTELATMLAASTADTPAEQHTRQPGLPPKCTDDGCDELRYRLDTGQLVQCPHCHPRQQMAS